MGLGEFALQEFKGRHIPQNGFNKKIKKFYGCYFSIDKMSSNELEKMEQFLNSKNLRPRSLLF